MSVIESASEAPMPVRSQSSLMPRHVEVDLVVGALARQLVLGHAAGGGVRQLGDGLEVARDLEAREASGRPVADAGQIGAVAHDDERLDLLLGQLRGHADDRRLDHVGVGLSASSTSAGARFSPRRRMTSFWRPMNV